MKTTLKTLGAMLGLLALSALPVSADTAPLLLVFNTSGAATGQAASVRVVVTDSTGAVIIASTNTPNGTTAFSESSVIPGEYSAPATVTYTPANLPLKAEYTISGTTPLVSGVAVYLTERGSEAAAGYTATLPGTLITGQTSIKSDTTKIGTAAGQAATAPAWYTVPAFPSSVIVGGYAAGQDPLTLLAASFAAIPAAVENFNVGGQAGTLTKRVSDAISSSVAGGSYLPGGINLTTHTQAVTYYLPGTTLAAMNAGSAVVVDSALVTYDVTNTKILSRVDTPGTF